MHARRPRRRIPVIADTYVDREFGTGALKITPGHDPSDYEIGRRVGLPTLNIMNDDGTLNAAAGAYAGLDRFAARERIWANMEVRLWKLQYTLRLLLDALLGFQILDRNMHSMHCNPPTWT